MKSTNNIASMVNTLRLDIEDTLSKLSRFKNWFKAFSCQLETARLYDGKTMTIQEFNDLANELNSYTPDLLAIDWDPGYTFMLNQPIQLQRMGYVDTDIWEATIQLTKSGVEKYVMLLLSLVEREGSYRCEATVLVDAEPVDIDSFVFENEIIDDKSILSIISDLDDASMTDEFLLDCCTMARNPVSMPTLLNKWTNSSKISSNVRSIVNSAAENFDGTVQSVLCWIKDIYQSMQNPEVSSDGSITFSDPNVRVKLSFATVANVAITALTTALAAIGFVIGKVVAVITLAISSLFSAVTQAISQRLNPIITVKNNATGYEDFLPFPIAQVQYDSGSLYVAEDKPFNFRINSLFYTMRVFRDKGENKPTCFEIFPRAAIEPVTFARWISYTFESGDISSYGLTELEKVSSRYQAIIARGNEWQGMSKSSGFILGELTQECGQANYIFLIMCVLGLYLLRNTTPSATDNFTSAWDRLKANKNTPSSASSQDLFDVCYWGLHRVRDYPWGGTDDREAYFYGDGVPMTTSIQHLYWDEIFNIMQPIMIAKIGDFINGSAEYGCIRSCMTGNFIDANDDFETALSSEITPYYMDYISTGFLNDPFFISSSPWILPKTSSHGAVRAIILNAIFVAATVAVAVTATIAFKNFARTMDINRTRRLGELKEFNDAVQKDPHYSSSEKLESQKWYVKAAKAYNRTSWIYGGGTWSFTNGWVDYASASYSVADLSESLKNDLAAGTVLLDTDSDQSSISAIRQGAMLSTLSGDDTVGLLDVIHLIRGV